MNEDVMISVAMATYNGERFLHEQIDSILAQTHQNFELVICDDCSTDGTAGILREYEAQDSRIRVYVNESNLGFKKNLRVQFPCAKASTSRSLTRMISGCRSI